MNIDSTAGRLGEHPSWIVCLFKGNGIRVDSAGWKVFPTKAGRAKMIGSLRRFAEVEFDVLPADTRYSRCRVRRDPGNRETRLRLTCEEEGLMGPAGDFSHIPIIDVSELVAGGPYERAVAERLGEACRESGFFYVVGHGVDEALQAWLRELSRGSFAQDLETKQRIRMALGGRAWRGYFRVGDELTSGRPDQKEGVYFGAELAADDPRVRAGTPLHGPDLFPAEPEGFREAVLQYMAALTGLGHRLMAGLALSLDLEESYRSRSSSAPISSPAGPADRVDGPGSASRRPGRALGSRQRPCVRGDLWRLPRQQGRQGLPRVAIDGALITRTEKAVAPTD